MQTITIAGRANNYNYPHQNAAMLAPSSKVTAAVAMHPTNTSTLHSDNNNNIANTNNNASHVSKSSNYRYANVFNIHGTNNTQ